MIMSNTNTILYSFLEDIFCVSSLKLQVQNIETIFDTEKECLDYKRLFAHPRVVQVISVAHVFRDTFGFFPSFTFLGNSIDTDNYLSYIQNNTFLSMMKSESPLGQAFIKAQSLYGNYTYTMKNDLKNAKKLVWNWLSRNSAELSIVHYDESKSLLSLFSSHLSSSFKVSEVDITYLPNVTDDLLDKDPLRVMCHYEYDAIAHHTIFNFNLFRKLIERPLVTFTNCNIDSNLLQRSVEVIACMLSNEINVKGLAIDNFSSPPKYNINYLCKDCLIPSNLTTLEFKISSLEHSNILLVNTSKGNMYFFTSKNDVSKHINELCYYPCVPVFADTLIASEYLKMGYEKLDVANINNAPLVQKAKSYRIHVYNALIPQLPEFMSPLPFPLQYSPPPTKQNTILLIDNRENPLSILALYVTCNNLNMNLWNVNIMTSKKCTSFYSRYFPHATITTPDLLEINGFNIETYNKLLKSNTIWQYLHDLGVQKCLLIQDDGMLVKKGLETHEVFTNTYTYVGAPWLHCNENLENALLTKNKMIGNGGFSLRNPLDMLEICTKYSKEANMLFNKRLQKVQEDVYFGMYAANVPSYEVASSFSVEQVYNKNAIGFHKMWMYNPLEAIHEFVKTILN